MSAPTRLATILCSLSVSLLWLVPGAAGFAAPTDPAPLLAYLKASNTDAGDFFGQSVALSGDTLVIGADFEASTATGVDGDQSDDGGYQSGAVYVFVRDGDTWRQQAYLKASNTGAVDWFGTSVAISGDTLVVGATGEDSDARQIDGDQANDDAPLAGAAYVFTRVGESWNQEAYLKASNGEGGGPGDPFGDLFGTSVAISGDTIVIGATGEDSGATGVDGNQNSNAAPSSGAVYVFVRNGGSWSQEAYVKASDAQAFDEFGGAVALSEETLVVGASNPSYSSGDAYVFVRSAGVWSEQAKLRGSNTNPTDAFGSSVAVHGDTLIVGAMLEASAATGVDGDESDNSAHGAGAAYIFVRSGTTWIQEAYLKPSNTDAGDYFGSSVSLSGNVVVVGSWGEASGSSATPDDDSAPRAGAAYAFRRGGGTWNQAAYIKAPNTDAGDAFAMEVALDHGVILIGARDEDSRATGVDGDQSDNSAGGPGQLGAGAAYTYELLVGLNYCVGAVNSTGVGGRIFARGSNTIADGELTLHVADTPPNRTGIFFYGDTQTQVPLGDGFRCVGSPRMLYPPVRTDGSGRAERTLDFTVEPLLSDIAMTAPGRWNFQFWYRDVAATSNLTDALSIDLFD